MNNKSCNILSEIHLATTETTVFLEDYFLDAKSIKQIIAPFGIEVWHNKETDRIKLAITDSSIILPVSDLNITFDDGTTESIVLIKPKVVLHTLKYYPRGNVSSVKVAGDFNSWNPEGYCFLRKDTYWEYTLEIESGNYAYQLIVDGNWINDPLNSEVLENGYGGFNSLLRVPFPDSEKMVLETEQTYEDNIIISVNESVSGHLVLWNNNVINDTNTFRQHDRIVITIPSEAKNIERSYIRVFGYNTETMTNDILIPLEYGNAVTESGKLNRNDKESQLIYFALIDRFKNGNPSNDKAITSVPIHAKLNYYGGDLVGIKQKIEDGYFQQLGVTTIWISPVVKNTETPIEKNGRISSAYHGYWPLISDKIDEHFGSEQDLHDLVETAHNHNINIILDYVANHVHKDNSIILKNPTWCTPLYLPDGSKNIGRWEDHRFTTWFEDFLPTLDYNKPAVRDTMTDIAVEWLEKYDLDGFRHDATKHIQTEFWRELTKKLKQRVVIPKQKRLFQIGETFGGRKMLQSYINSGIHDSQFSFNLYYETRSAFLYEDVHFEKLSICLRQEMDFFGSHHLMGNISGNHDLPRFISYAGEDLWTNQNAEHEGWSRHITVKNPIGYKKLAMLLAFNATIPGIPVIYYGDEIGIPGGADPDNRRPMYFTGLSKNESENLAVAQKIGQLRKDFLPLIYGTFSFEKIEKQVLVYRRKYFEEYAYVCFNKSRTSQTIDIELPKPIDSSELLSFSQCNFLIQNRHVSIEVPPMSFEVLYHRHGVIAQPKPQQKQFIGNYEEFLD